jgi:glyoxalase family protein
MSTHSIHHVTAVTAKIGQNLDYYTRVVGLRLVKRSVNQDDVSAYHLFYADAVGTPGTDMTFFDWPMVGRNRPGAGTVALTSFRAPQASFDWWEKRLTEAGSAPQRATDEQGRQRLQFSDPEGQRLELVDDAGLPMKAVPWDAEVPAEHALRGIMGVDLESARPESTKHVLTELLGFQAVDGHPGTFETEDADHYGRVRIIEPSPDFGRVGAGGVHHVAFRVQDEEELLEMQRRVEAVGISTSGLVDRFYFESLYFREPGGILFELATDGPGFASDESHDSLGERLALPPFLEPRRQEIEAGLKPLPARGSVAR